MNAREAISQIACDLPDERVEKLVDYAPYLSHQEERAGWQEFGKLQLSKMYGDDEPEYTEADLKRKAYIVNAGDVVLISLPQASGGPAKLRPV